LASRCCLLSDGTIAGYNVECIRSFKARETAEAEAIDAKNKRRAKRRKGTWTQILDEKTHSSGPGPDPPG
jgi:hypothetical protein